MPSDELGKWIKAVYVPAGSFADNEQYEQSAARGLDWGIGLLQRPFVLLNSRQNLETGVNGVQLTTNSQALGQHALELKH